MSTNDKITISQQNSYALSIPFHNKMPLSNVRLYLDGNEYLESLCDETDFENYGHLRGEYFGSSSYLRGGGFVWEVMSGYKTIRLTIQTKKQKEEWKTIIDEVIDFKEEAIKYQIMTFEKFPYNDLYSLDECERIKEKMIDDIRNNNNCPWDSGAIINLNNSKYNISIVLRQTEHQNSHEFISGIDKGKFQIASINYEMI